MRRSWPVQDAKARFGEMLAACEDEGPHQDFAAFDAPILNPFESASAPWWRSENRTARSASSASADITSIDGGDRHPKFGFRRARPPAPGAAATTEKADP